MKRSIKTGTVALGLITGILSTFGSTNYWDTNGATPGFGTAGGTWGTEPKWSSDSTGASVPAVTNTTASDDLHFGTVFSGLATGTVAVEGTNQAFRSITFGTASGPITLSGGTLTLAAPASEIFVGNASNTIASVLAGAGGLQKHSDLLTYAPFLTDTSVTLFTNASLSGYLNVTATMSGNSISGGSTTAQPYYFTNSGTTATAQMQAVNGGFTKCVKIELTQSGPDIAGRALYARYTGENQLGFDFDTGGTNVSIATAPTVGAYGITQLRLSADRVLTLTGVNTYSGDTAIDGGVLTIGGEGQLGSGSYAGAIVNSGKLLYGSVSNQTLCGAISGIGSLVLECPSKSVSSITYTNFLKASATAIIPHSSLADCVGADGLMGGLSVNGGSGPCPADAYFFTNRGATVTYQLQAFEGGATKCVKVELSQLGAGITARAVYAKYVLDNHLGFDFDTGGTALAIATSYATGNYGAAETTLSLNSSPRLILSGINSYTGGTVVKGGVLEAATTNLALPSSGGITVNNGGELVLNAGPLNSGSPGGVGNLNPITVNSGGTLTLAGTFNVGFSRPVILNGGTLNSTVTEVGDCANYVNNLTLQNGARVTGYKIRMGDIGGYPPSIVVSGTSASSLEAGINIAKVGTQSLTFNVADATGDPEPDLFIPGVIQDYNLPHLTGMPIIKTGAGTLSLSGVNTHTGRVTITAGALALGADTTLNTGCRIVLNGGALAMGAFSNVVNTLTLSAGSEIVLGDGKLAFADSSGVPWSSTLTLTGTLDPHTLRFGTNARALTGAQLSAINLNGERVRLKEDGYLAPALKGTLLRIQ